MMVNAERRDGALDHAAAAAERVRQPVPDDLLDRRGVDRASPRRLGWRLAHSAPAGRSS